MTWWYGEPDRDPQLSSAMSELEETPFEAENDLLRSRIMAAARFRLASLSNSPPAWWELVWARAAVAVPVGLAAALAAVLLMPGSHELSAPQYGLYGGPDSTLMLAAFSEDAGSQLAQRLVPASPDWVLEQAISR